MIYGNALMPGGSGKAGATLTVSAPLGSVITISKDGESYSSSLLPAVFKGLSSGTWTRTATLNGQTSEKFIQIVADYVDAVEYFAATINVTFPAGSIVECRQGDYVISTTDTSGSHVFTVPNSGTWTVTATDGTNSTSQNVEITAHGQSVSVTLSYWDGILYDAGNERTEITGGWTVSGSASLKSTYINCVASAQNQANAYTTNMIDLTPFTTLHITISNVATDLFVGVPSVIKSTVEATKNGASHKIQPTKAGTHTLDISSVNESRYIWCGNWSESDNSFGARVSKVWLT